MTKDITATARAFFEACETGKGWAGCKQYCADNASFSAQSDAIADIETLEAYCDWMKGLLTFIEDGRYELKSFATDPERGSVCAYGIFHGTHTGERGPVPPTGKALSADYVYNMDCLDARTMHMTKVWNATWSFGGLGWS